MLPSYLSRGHLYEESSSNQDIYPGTSDTPEFSQEEKEIISYLAGYARGTLSRRIRSSKDWNTKTNQDNLKILAAGRTTFDHEDLGLVNLHDRGGLWKVREQERKIFTVADS